MENSGRFYADEVYYDKVWWHKTISFPNTYTTYNFKIVKLNKKFYVFISDMYPNLLYEGRTGPFNSFDEAYSALEEDLGSNFPSVKNKITKAKKVIVIMVSLILFFTLNYYLFPFIHGGLNEIGIHDDNYTIAGFILSLLNIIVIIKISRLKK